VRILVTGGLGVNGAWVTKRFAELGHDVSVLDRMTDTSSLGRAADSVRIFEADVSDLEQVSGVMSQCQPEVVVHMAALVGSREAYETFHVNADATVGMLEAARLNHVRRFVFTSSRAVYGEISGEAGHPTYVPIAEDAPFSPVRAYDVAKIASEGMGQVYQRLFGIEFVALRFASIFGPGKTVRHAGTAIYSRMIDMAVAGELVRIEKGGDQLDDVIYVEDVAESVVLAATINGPLSSAYNISRGVATSLHDLADAIRVAIPSADIEIGPGLDYFDMGVSYYSVLDNELAHKELGFTPQYDLISGVARYLDAKRLLTGSKA
jgi:UDP-glucose 4-epimerase